jgi:PAS domain S-box-containing protein
MQSQATYYAIPLLLGATVAIALVFLAWQRIREPGARAFMMAMGGVALWSFAYAFEIMNMTLEGKRLWHYLIYMASSILPAFWLIFLLQQEDRPRRALRVWVGLLMIEPVLYTLLTWTNDLPLPWLGGPHHLLWSSIDIETGKNGLPMLALERSIGFYIHTVYTYFLVFFSMSIVMRMLKRESSTLAYWQVILLVAGIFAPIVVNLLHLMPFNPLPINMTPFALISMGTVVGWFAFRFELWDIIPAAHDAIFEHMHDGVIIISQKNMVIDLNPAAARLIGFDKERIGSLPIDTALPQWSSVIGLQQLLQERGPIMPTAFEVAVIEPTPRHLELIVSDLRDRRQRLNGRLLTIRDITRRFEMEKALADERTLLAQRVAERTADLSEANAKLERAARLKDEFMASMSHELRTPLSTILALAEAMQEEVYGGLVQRQKRALTNIEESGRHLLSLINDVLDVAKIEAGKLKLALGPIAVDSLCQSALNFIKPAAINKQQELLLDLDPSVKIVVGDDRRLKQILVNLLNNAVKFTPNEGQIGLRVQGHAKDECLRFTIWDTGVGIAPEDMDKLFEPFVQIDSRLARQYEGTGLGLALVYRMTKLHGGSISVESEVGKGSCFTVSLPWSAHDQRTITFNTLRRSEADATALAVVAPPFPLAENGAAVDHILGDHTNGVARLKVFIADDNETNTNVFTDYLRSRGYEVDVAHNGADALLRLREAKPDLILMDIQMPGMDGLEVMQQVRKDDGLQHIPIVALTALAMPGDRDRCLAAGADEYLSKPISLQRLIYLIENHAYKREM